MSNTDREARRATLPKRKVKFRHTLPLIHSHNHKHIVSLRIVTFTRVRVIRQTLHVSVRLFWWIWYVYCTLVCVDEFVWTLHCIPTKLPCSIDFRRKSFFAGYEAWFCPIRVIKLNEVLVYFMSYCIDFNSVNELFIKLCIDKELLLIIKQR